MIKNYKTNKLFKVRLKENGNLLDVYAIRDDKKGYPHFLIYMNKQWKYESAKYFEPIY